MRKFLTTLATLPVAITLISAPGVADAVTLSTKSTVSSAAVAKAAAPRPAEPVKIDWKACGTIGGECAKIKMPINWDKPAGAKFDLVIGRVKATDPAKRLGILFVYPGGPGGPGLDSYITQKNLIASSRLHDRFDIVSLDPRGVGLSNPVKCDSKLLAQSPTDFPANEQEYKNLLAHNAKLGADCRKNTGELFDHVDTVSAIKDVDAIRAALGEKQLTFYGASYGTQVGQQYAELFPQRVRAMTIDSDMDHSITSSFRYMETASEDLEGSFLTFADWCERTAGCALHGVDVVALFDRLYAKAEKGELTDPANNGAKVTPNNLRGIVFSPMYRPESRWVPLAKTLAVLDGRMAPEPEAKVRYAPRVTAHADGLAENSYQAIWCEDWKWDVTSYGQLKSYKDAIAAIAPHTRLSPFYSDITTCLGWPAKVVNPQHRLKVNGTPNILITGSKYDVATPIAWTEAVARQIRNSTLLRYDGIGHGDYYQSPCVKQHIETYLIDVKSPPKGTRCPAVWPTATAKRNVPSEPIPVRPTH